MMTERNSVETPLELATPTNGPLPEHPASHTYSPLTGTPFKKNKIKNCEC